MNNNLPLISVVIIGLNISEKVVNCIKSVKESKYPNLEIIYVDGGSSDGSVEKVKKLGYVKVIESNHENQTGGRQRNIGWRSSKSDLIQFLDGDVLMDPNWINHAFKKINDRFIAVCGYRKERYPNKNWYNLINDIDWEKNIGETHHFGAEVLIKKSVLDDVGGYDDELISGQNGDISFRIKEKGYHILRIDKIMSYHNIKKNNFRKYFWRNFRHGYGHIQVAIRHYKKNGRRLLNNYIKIVIKGILNPVLILLFIFFKNFYFLIFIFLINLNTMATFFLSKRKGFNNKQSLIYVAHQLFFIYPFTLGIFRFFIGKLFNYPFKNKKLIGRLY